jgi:hypothetical protein
MAQLSFGMSCIKGLLFLLNLSFFVAGGLMIGLAAYAYHTGELYGVVVVPNLAIGVIVLGSIVAGIAFFGCCGSIQESRCLLVLYFIFVLVIMLAQFGIGFAVIKYSSDVPVLVEQSWNTSTPDERRVVEQTFQCCGLHQFDINGCGANVTTTTTCYNKLVTFVENALRTLEIVAFVVGSVEVLGLLFSCCLVAAITERKTEHKRLLREAVIVNQQ